MAFSAGKDMKKVGVDAAFVSAMGRMPKVEERWDFTVVSAGPVVDTYFRE